MTVFLAAIVAFPTVVFSGLLAVCILYWLFVVIGAAEIDLLDLDGAMDGSVECVAEAAGEAAAEAAMEAASEGALDGAVDAAEGGVLIGLLSSRLKAAPLTVTISVFALSGWILSFLGMQHLGGILPASFIGVAVFGLTLVIAMPLTLTLIQPLGPIFRPVVGRSRSDLAGHSCHVTTGRVDVRFGQAEVTIDRDHLVIQVRSKVGNGLGRGDEALIIEYSEADEAYLIESMRAG